MAAGPMTGAKSYTEMAEVQLVDEESKTATETASSEDEACAQGSYCAKLKGAGEPGPPQLSLAYCGWSFLGAFAGMSAIALLHSYVLLPVAGTPLLIGAFGAMSVIVFSAFKAPVAQPKNVIVGNTLGGLVGVLVLEAFKLLGLTNLVWLMAALSVSLTIVAQELTNTVHPPGGATALIYVTMPLVQHLGFKYVLCPSFLGAVIMVAVACITNNLSGERTYPQFWYPDAEAKAADLSGRSGVGRYLAKFKGAGAAPAPAPPLDATWNSFLGSFTAIAILGLIHAYTLPHFHMPVLIGAFGAMSVIVFSAWKVPFAQPKNAIVGNTLGGLVGVSVYNLLQLTGLGSQLWLGAALSVALTITVQELTNTVHPPGGATALLFDIIPAFHTLEYTFVFTPSFLGTCVLVGVGLLTNNLVEKRSYPQYWFP